MRQRAPAPPRPARPWWLLGLVILALVPHGAWLLKRPRTLEVRIVDKTVPDASYREHLGLIWLLNQQKIVHPDGTSYEEARDYYGFVPRSRPKFDVREPDLGAPGADVLYLADSYGVYSEEWEGVAQGNRSRLIYGGLRLDEVEALMRGLDRGASTLVMEFNAFASPTEAQARRACETLLGLRWSGWIGRRFEDLANGVEVPRWAVQLHEQQTGAPWTFRGPGLLFVHSSDRILVLTEAQDLTASGVVFSPSEDLGTRLGLQGRVRYDYWFDAVATEPGTDVLGTFQLPVTAQARKRLEQAGISSTLPAVTRRQAQGRTMYYFAGDFVDTLAPPMLRRMAGWDAVHRWLSSEGDSTGSAFFHRVYVPLMKGILADAEANRPR